MTVVYSIEKTRCQEFEVDRSRALDVSWVKIDRWEALSVEERQGFAPLCPDFVVELRSPSDSLKPLRQKMQKYIDNGARLG
ncbi:MAG: Uma2 family endonuclease [Cyanobacteria bacterium SID2]|nr:Uma2 family endonuclease [Cyanobacteria bacterium SID2]MBP0003056.1 Uma2 family endonuclease [Cyanobacteria bacterium SBC]